LQKSPHLKGLLAGYGMGRWHHHHVTQPLTETLFTTAMQAAQRIAESSADVLVVTHPVSLTGIDQKGQEQAVGLIERLRE
jgi:hypothetical protein